MDLEKLENFDIIARSDPWIVTEKIMNETLVLLKFVILIVKIIPFFLLLCILLHDQKLLLLCHPLLFAFFTFPVIHEHVFWCLFLSVFCCANAREFWDWL